MSSDWKICTLGELGTIKTGKTPPSSLGAAFGGTIPFVTPGDMTGQKWVTVTNRCLNEKGLAAVSSSLMPARSVAVSCIGSDMGKAVLLSRPSVTNQQINSIAVDESRFNAEFVYYDLSVRQQELKAAASGSATPILNKGHFSELEISLPPKATQDKIAAILGGLDEKIAVNRRINQTLEALAQAIFKSWFVDFYPVKAKIAAKQEGRDPLRAAMSAISGKPDFELDALPREQFDQLVAIATLFPEEMEESELGEIPRGWDVSKVETLLARLSAKTRYTKDQVFEYGQTPVFEQGASIVLGYHDATATYQASASDPAFIFGDHTCVTRLSCQPFDISQNVIPLRGRGSATTWVYYAVKEKQKFQEYRRHWMELISKDVVIASADICLEFSKKVSIFHLQMEENERQIQGLRELRDTLLPKLLSGELSATEAMAEVEA